MSPSAAIDSPLIFHLTPDGSNDWASMFPSEYSAIPPHMRDALYRYVVEHLPVGDFLTAVICNDLRRAVFSADATNLPLLKLYALWFYNMAPGFCNGNSDVMAKWLAAK
jgi:hypothetical protein